MLASKESMKRFMRHSERCYQMLKSIKIKFEGIEPILEVITKKAIAQHIMKEVYLILLEALYLK